MRERIGELRTVIRYHRDQKGDDRCWLDDFLVWKKVTGKDITELPTYEEGMAKCRSYFRLRSMKSLDPTLANAVIDPGKWDDDLATMDEEQLRRECLRIEQAIRKHDAIVGRERTVDDDRELYSVLPEKIPADFRLPCEKDFLGTTKTSAGCPQFWKSHSSCSGEHNLHQWGPCDNGHR